MIKTLQIIATMVSKSGQEAQVHGLLLPAVKQFRAEPGCLGYILLEDNHRAGRFMTYETWNDPASLSDHMKSPAMTDLAPKLMPLLEGAIKQDFLTVLVELQ